MSSLSIKFCFALLFKTLLVYLMQVLDRVYMQLQTFFDDPMYREHHAVLVELIRTLARCGPNAEPKFQDECESFPFSFLCFFLLFFRRPSIQLPFCSLSCLTLSIGTMAFLQDNVCFLSPGHVPPFFFYKFSYLTTSAAPFLLYTSLHAWL